MTRTHTSNPFSPVRRSTPTSAEARRSTDNVVTPSTEHRRHPSEILADQHTAGTAKMPATTGNTSRNTPGAGDATASTKSTCDGTTEPRNRSPTRRDRTLRRSRLASAIDPSLCHREPRPIQTHEIEHLVRRTRRVAPVLIHDSPLSELTLRMSRHCPECCTFTRVPDGGMVPGVPPPPPPVLATAISAIGSYRDAGAGQAILVLQAGDNGHDHIMESPERFGSDRVRLRRNRRRDRPAGRTPARGCDRRGRR
jgi:hypothetical protein